MRPGNWKTTAQRGVSKAMEPQCGRFYVQVNPDASHLVARPAEFGTASAAEHDFPGLARSVDTGGRPPAPTHDGLPDCGLSSSTAARDRSASTPPPGIRIGRSTAIVRRPWARCLSHGSTSKVRVELKSPILFTSGARPPWRQRAWLLHHIWARCRFFLSSGLSLSPPSTSPAAEPDATRTTIRVKADTSEACRNAIHDRRCP